MSSIFEFAKNGDLDGVKNLIENGTDVNIKNEDEETLYITHVLKVI